MENEYATHFINNSTVEQIIGESDFWSDICTLLFPALLGGALAIWSLQNGWNGRS
jgi:hypothetical protein